MQGSWTSTIKRIELAQTTNTPVFKYDFEYQLPVDPKSLKVLDVDNSQTLDIEYSIEGDKLLTDAETIKIKYIAQLTNTEDWDTMLTEAVEISLASYMAMSLTGQEVIAEKLKQEYLFFVDNNLAVDGQQGSDSSYFATELLDVRTNGHSGGHIG